MVWLTSEFITTARVHGKKEHRAASRHCGLAAQCCACHEHVSYYAAMGLLEKRVCVCVFVLSHELLNTAHTTCVSLTNNSRLLMLVHT